MQASRQDIDDGCVRLLRLWQLEFLETWRLVKRTDDGGAHGRDSRRHRHEAYSSGVYIASGQRFRLALPKPQR
jgi:hypothetical protein